MGYSKKELKFYIKQLKNALKLIKKIDKSNYGLSLTYIRIREQIQQDLAYYEDQLKRLKEDKE